MNQSKKQEAPLAVVAATNAEFLSMVSTPGLKVVDVYSKWVGPCEAMVTIFKRYKVDYAENIHFVQAVADNISCFEAFRDHSCPTFFFIINKVFVKLVRGANAPALEKTIKEQMAIEEQGLPHTPAPLDGTTTAITAFLSPEEPASNRVESILVAHASSHGQSRRSSQLSTSSRRVSIVETAEVIGDRSEVPGSSLETYENDLSGPSAVAEPLTDPATAEHTLALLKPDAMNPGIVEDVLSTIYHHRFDVLQIKKIWLTQDQVAELYREAEGKDYFPQLLDYVSCAPVLALELAKTNGIQAWRKVVGPRDPKDARADAPHSLRGLYGQDRLLNSFHASDGPVSAARELSFIFAPNASFPILDFTPPSHPKSTQTTGLPQKTLAVIKPNAMLKVDQIISRIVSRGYKVVKKDEIMLNVERAQELSIEFLETPLFEESVRELMSAPVLCLMLKGENVIEGWMEMLGPSDPEDARRLYPMSLRAQFGLNAASNGIHGSQTLELAIQQLQSFFPHHINASGGRSSIFKTPMGSLQASRAGSKTFLLTETMRASVTRMEIQRESDRAASYAKLAATVPSPIQRTLALIKPDAYPTRKDEILERIQADGFEVVAQKEIQLDSSTAREFYKDHADKLFYEELTGWMSSAPVYAMVLERIDGIKAWRALAGPTNSNKAREENPQCIRALFGTDGTQNAVHGSDSLASALKEISLLFPSVVSPTPEYQRTLALIKPDVYPSKKSDIISKIKLDGFTIVQEAEIQFTEGQAKEFYREHEGEGFYEELTTWMSSAPIYAMVLEKAAGIKAWRNLAGPTNSDKARESAPYSLRAMFGTDGSLNGVHGSDSIASAEREIRIVFGEEVSPLAVGPKPDTGVSLSGPKLTSSFEEAFPRGGITDDSRPTTAAPSEVHPHASMPPSSAVSRPSSHVASKMASQVGTRVASRQNMADTHNVPEA
ncbi:nucleoside diphosphate kinase [Chytriomyces sp. MP71]|nr:nucleoside diphosphate kinase [Chytriomyces sp. MP71]